MALSLSCGVYFLPAIAEHVSVAFVCVLAASESWA